MPRGSDSRLNHIEEIYYMNIISNLNTKGNGREEAQERIRRIHA